jgi:hypothetical protein
MFYQDNVDDKVAIIPTIRAEVPEFSNDEVLAIPIESRAAIGVEPVSDESDIENELESLINENVQVKIRNRRPQYLHSRYLLPPWLPNQNPFSPVHLHWLKNPIHFKHWIHHLVDPPHQQVVIHQVCQKYNVRYKVFGARFKYYVLYDVYDYVFKISQNSRLNQDK